MSAKAWQTYILQCADGTLYCGATNNLTKRLNQHNAGQGAKYTVGRAPVKLVWQSSFNTHGDALREELRIKKMTRAQKLRLIANLT